MDRHHRRARELQEQRRNQNCFCGEQRVERDNETADRRRVAPGELAIGREDQGWARLRGGEGVCLEATEVPDVFRTRAPCCRRWPPPTPPRRARLLRLQAVLVTLTAAYRVSRRGITEIARDLFRREPVDRRG
ncbi:MAG: hypothetical protein ACYC6M_03775 [Terriglobales bacterium]